VVELKDTEDDFRVTENFEIDLGQRPGRDSYPLLEEI